MIKVDFSNGIKIETGDLQLAFSPDQLPLKVDIQRAVSKEVIWTTELNSNMWATYPESEINNVVVYDAKGKFVYQRNWEAVVDGSIFYQSLILYCKSIANKSHKPKGLVIGTHDGEFGEWVPIVQNRDCEVILVEASDKQFQNLQYNYRNNSRVKKIQALVTPNGGEVEFYEGGEGYTNSVVENVIRHWEKEEIKSTKINSISITDLILNECNGYIDWLHLDVEGLDAQLIMGIDETKVILPNFIIFEDYNLVQDKKDEIYSWLHEKGYNTYSEGGICEAIKY